MGIFWTIVGICIVALDLWAIASVFQSSKSGSAKIGWAVLIVVFPVLGLIIWGVAGPRGMAQPPTSPGSGQG
ncbi:PLD nuclease N-terminal domain-containing protein [Pseudomonas sp. Marseille-QA0892]